MKFVILIILVVVFLFCLMPGSGVPITDYNRGYSEGQGYARTVRKELGIFGQVLGELGSIVQYGPDNNESADWHAGFQAGLRDELQTYYGR